MKSPLTCPQCGATMNQHTSKTVHSSEDIAGDRETMLAIHSCPGCGASAVTSE